MMKVECPQCGTGGKLDAAKLPQGGASIRCPACRAVFRVTPPSAEAAGSARASGGTGPLPASAASPSAPDGVSGAAAETTPPADDLRQPDSTGSTSGLGAASDSTGGRAGVADDADGDPAGWKISGSRATARSALSDALGALGLDGDEGTAEAAATEGPAARSEPAAQGRFSVTASMPTLDPALLRAAREAVGGPSAAAAPASANAAGGGALSAGGGSAAGTGVRITSRHVALSAGRPEAARDEGGAQQPFGSVAAGVAPSAAPPSVASETADPNPSSISQRRAAVASAAASSAPRKRPAGAWKVRAAAGIVYDFSDVDSLRAWLQTRASHEGLEVSGDGGATYGEIDAHESLAGVKPGVSRGPSTRSLTGLDVAPRTTPPPPAPSEYESAAAQAAARAARATVTGKSAPTTGKQAAVSGKQRSVDDRRGDGPSGGGPQWKRLAILVGMLLLTVGVAAGYLSLTAAPRIPNTPAGRQFSWILEAMNERAPLMSASEVETRFSQDVLRQVTADALLRELRFWHERYDSHTYVGLQGPSTPLSLSARIVTPTTDEGIVTVVVEAEAPHKITQWYIRPAQ